MAKKKRIRHEQNIPGKKTQDDNFYSSYVSLKKYNQKKGFGKTDKNKRM